MKRFEYLIILLLLINLGSYRAKGQSTDCLAPLIEPKGQVFLCNGNPIQLKTAPSMANLQWYKNNIAIDGATDHFLTIDEEGIYTVTAFDGECSKMSEESVVKHATNYTTPQLKIQSNGSLRFCEGGNVELSVEGNFSSYYWSTGDRTASVVITAPGEYTVEAFTGNCSVFGEVTVTAMPLPNIEIAAKGTVFQLGQSIELLATGAEDISWFPSEGLSGTMIANPTATPSQTMTYYVTGTSANGCRDTTSITLHLDERRMYLSPPKVFSPNNDGTDDYWVIENNTAYANCELTIFNRQGIEVFKAQPYHNDWNGIYKGTPLPEGDYYYVIQCGGREKLKTGSIMLVR